MTWIEVRDLRDEDEVFFIPISAFSGLGYDEKMITMEGLDTTFRLFENPGTQLSLTTMREITKDLMKEIDLLHTATSPEPHTLDINFKAQQFSEPHLQNNTMKNSSTGTNGTYTPVPPPTNYQKDNEAAKEYLKGLKRICESYKCTSCPLLLVDHELCNFLAKKEGREDENVRRSY